MDNNPYILVVDDEDITIEAIKIYLKEKDYNVLTAKNGKSAIDIIAKNPQISCIILDVNMPVLNGYETCKKLKSDPETKDIPIIFVTGDDKIKTNASKFFNIGAEDFLTKPYDYHSLLAKIGIMVKLKQNIDRLKQERDVIKSLVDNANAIILMTDKDFNIVSYNKQSLELFNQQNADLKKQNLLELIYPDQNYRNGIKNTLGIFIESRKEKIRNRNNCF